MAIARITVDIGVANQRLAELETQAGQIKTFITAINHTLTIALAISWVSPAAKALVIKFQALLEVIERALRIVERYIADLKLVIEQTMAVEGRLEDGIVGRLRTDDVFGN